MLIQDRLWQRWARSMWMPLAAIGAAGVGAMLAMRK